MFIRVVHLIVIYIVFRFLNHKFFNIDLTLLKGMPLLHKAPYQFRSVPQNLKEDDEVFHIRASKEIFSTYEYPFHMQFLYNWIIYNT